MADKVFFGLFPLVLCLSVGAMWTRTLLIPAIVGLIVFALLPVVSAVMYWRRRR